MLVHSQDCCSQSDEVSNIFYIQACRIKCKIDKNNYLPGDVVYLEINIDNSHLDLQLYSISIHLINILTLTDDSGR